MNTNKPANNNNKKALNPNDTGFNTPLNVPAAEYQKTIKTPVSCTGVGVHSGLPVTLRLLPAPANYGIRFTRTDISPTSLRMSHAHVFALNLGWMILMKMPPSARSNI